MKEKITKFLEGENRDFLDFIAKLYPIKPEDITKNSKKTRQYNDRWFERVYLKNGIYKYIQEVDINGFSYNLLKIYSKDKRVKEIYEAIDSINDKNVDDYRIKRLKIALFLNLNYPFSPLFDHETYARIQEEMYKTMEKLHNYIKEKTKILAVGYDAITFKGDVTIEEINQIIKPSTCKIREYNQITKFYNNAIYTWPDGTKAVKSTTKTDQKYEDIKMKILEELDKENFESASKIINDSKTINPKKLQEYRKEVENVKLQGIL